MHLRKFLSNKPRTQLNTLASNYPFLLTMSLTRQFLREFRPLFRMLEEPFGVSPRYARSNSFFDDPFFHSPRALRPAVDVTEEGSNYVVEAELPGVKKEDVEVRIGDGGRSVTIEGKVAERRTSQIPQAQASEVDASASSASEGAYKYVVIP